MKKIIFLTLLLLTSYASLAQVGIGTPLPNASAQLDVVTSDKGVLIPRLALTSSTDVTTIVNGNVLSLLVFNTATNNDLTPGYHYWDGTRWQRLVNAQDIATLETLTSISQDDTTGTITYIDEDGASTVLDMASMIAANETLTVLALNGDGHTLEYTDEDGVVTQVDLQTVIDNFETLTSATFDPATGMLTYTDENGASTNLDLSQMIANFETLTSISQDNAAGTITYVDEDGVSTVLDMAAMIAANETLTIFNLSADGHTLEYTDEDGNTNTVDLETVIDNYETLTILGMNGDGIHLDYQDEDGNISQINLATVVAANETLTSATFDATTGVLTYTDEDGTANAIDLTGMIANFETLTSISQDTLAGTITYVDEDGVSTILDIAALIAENETVTSLTQNDTTGDITYTDESGNTSVADVVSDDSSNILQVGPDGGALLDQATIAANETLTSLTVNALAGTLSYTDEDGTVNVIDLTALIDAHETITTFELNADGHTLEYVDENGDLQTVDLEAIIDNFETVTELTVNAAAGTLTYTDEDGTVNTIDLTALVTAQETLTVFALSADGHTLEYTDEDGTTTQVDLETVINAYETVTSISQDVTAGTITYIDENGASTVLDIAAMIAGNETVTTLVDNGDGTYTYTSEDNTMVTFDVTQTGVGNPNTNGTTGTAGDIYVDESTGDIWSWDPNLGAWVNNSLSDFTPFDTDADGTNDARYLTYLADETTVRPNTDFAIRDNGQVGIGTNLPSNKLHVVNTADPLRLEGLQAGTTPATDEVLLTDVNGVVKKGGTIAAVAAANEPWFGTDDNAGATLNTEDIYQMGKVGIGTNDLSGFYRFRVLGGATGHPFNFVDDNGGKFGQIDSDGNSNAYLIFNKDGVESGRIQYASSYFGILATGSQNIWLDGDVGVGTFTPTHKLDVDGKTRVRDLTGADLATDVIVTADATTGELKEAGTLSAAAAATEPWFGVDDNMGATTNTEDIYHMGNIGIGTTTPQTPLQVYGTIRSGNNQTLDINPATGIVRYDQTGLDFEPLDISSQWLTFSTADVAATAIERMRIDENGNVGIGTTTPNEKLEVNGKVRVSDLTGADLATDVIVTADATTGELKEGGTLATVGSKWTNDNTNTRTYLTNLSDGTTARPAGSEVVITDNGDVTIGTTSTNVASYTPPVGELTLNVYNATDEARVAIQGDSPRVDFVDLAGGADDKWMQLNVDTGTARFRSLNDTGTGLVANNILVMDINNGNVGIGTGSPTSKLQVVGLPVYVDNAAAIAGGLTVGAFYHAGDGIVRVVF